MRTPERPHNGSHEKLAGIGLVLGAALGLVAGEVFLEDAGIGLVTGAMLGIVFGPALAHFDRKHPRDPEV